jgi:hypothetical protein
VSRIRAAEKQKRGGCSRFYKQANPTGFSDTDLDRNLCDLAGDVGNDEGSKPLATSNCRYATEELAVVRGFCASDH